MLEQSDLDPTAFAMVADTYMQEADMIFHNFGINAFNVSSVTDTGGPFLQVNAIDATQSDHPTFGPSGSLYFLTGHAIELYLKAMLIKNGKTKADLKGIGRDLEKSVEATRNIGVSVPNADLIIAFSEIHRGMEYRYPQAPRVNVMVPEMLFSCAKDLKSVYDSMG
ncbi:hypothetical protein [Roseicyclus marinus]|uniref:hypothetical protein n=1 Tax=Roseicyclus marinus TaxID=2161673 RepID=UPI0024E0691E|nr:hypothetical protein [Roseicyclus marinus]MDG3039849.1 hypothetical protein [Roseicyclus marinus]